MACAVPSEDCPNCECKKDSEACYACVVSNYQCGGTCLCCEEPELKNLNLGSDICKNKNRDRYCLYCDCISGNLPCFQCIKRNIPCEGTCSCCKDGGNKNIKKESIVEKSYATKERKADESPDDKRYEKKSFREKAMWIKKKREEKKSPVTGSASKSTTVKIKGTGGTTWADVVKKKPSSFKVEEKYGQLTFESNRPSNAGNDTDKTNRPSQHGDSCCSTEQTIYPGPHKTVSAASVLHESTLSADVRKLSPKQTEPNVRIIYGYYCLHCECVKGMEPCSTCTKTKLQCRGVCMCCLGSDNRLNDLQK